jgi:catechol 2,3-dioxygenase-like lactoylglutathione lyase family enzyme
MPFLPIAEQITFLNTADLDATATFYENIFGLKLWKNQGTCRIYQVSLDGYLGFCQNDTATGEHPDIIFTLVTPNQAGVDAWYDHLKAQGVEFVKEPATNPKYQIYHCFLHDPNGYLIEIQYFL